MQDEIHHVFLEAPSALDLLKTMKRLRPWLRQNDIKPIEFKQTVTLSGTIELELIFGSRHEASLFEQAFCQATPA